MDRHRLEPKHPKDCCHNPTTPKPMADWTTEIVFEESTGGDPQSKGYMGTFCGSRNYMPDYNEDLPCGRGKHQLVCGHCVTSQEPCGVNCHREDLSVVPFACSICEHEIRDVFRKKMTAEERARCRKFDGAVPFLSLAVYVEAVAKHLPNAKVNVTEENICILNECVKYIS